MDYVPHFVAAVEPLLLRIPGTFWGVLAGSLFSLGGVILANKNSARNQQVQLEADRRNKATDREMTLRKEIYLAAAEAIAVGFATIGRFSDLQREGDALIGQYIEKQPAIAKTYIVGNIETLTAILEVQGALDAAFNRLHVERLPGLKAKLDLAVARKQTDLALRRQTETLGLIRIESQNGRPDQSKWDALQAHFKFESDLVTVALQKQVPLEQAVSAAQLRLAESIGEDLVRLNSLLAPVIAAVRRELALPIDESSVNELVTRLARKQKEGLSSLVSQIRASMAPPSPIPPAPSPPTPPPEEQ